MFKNDTFFLFFAIRLSLPPMGEMGEMVQIFMSEIEWLTLLKCWDDIRQACQHHCSLYRTKVFSDSVR